ncbi:uncharacterized protein LOC128559563 [Mercenaria mercenaria]|uniref:uncharacterized protein LOC128559563 n=1 Tax=Mercenaria mercenaria TaxID=6596 RepID=UPI00234F0F28|nr:uncharacterized protein LOC128559563 [Mercenaria mercenaria]
MEVSGRRTGSGDKTTQERVCHPCQEDGVTKQAYGYCKTCKEYLCETCYKYHRKPKPCKDHILVDDIDGYESEKDEIPPPVPERKKKFNTKCNDHRNEDLKYYCRTHDIIICSVCALKRHKECEDVDYIPEICNATNTLLIKKIEYVEDKVKYQLKQERDAVQSAAEYHELALSAINTQREQVIRYFEETEKHFSDCILRFREESKKRENELLETDQELKTKKSLMTKQTSGSETEKFLSIQRAEEEVKNINVKISRLFDLPSLAVSYEPKYPLPPLGKANVEEQQGNVGTKKLKLLKTVNVAGEETGCSIFDAAILSESPVSLLLVDFLNGRLILTSDSHVIDSYQCLSKAWGVARLSETEVAVSFPEFGEVQFFTVGDTISRSNRKSIEFSDTSMPAGIRYYRSGCSLVVCFFDGDRSRLEIWSLEGKLLRTISSFDYRTHMTHIVDDKILLSSSVNHSACLLGLDGIVIKTFQFIDDNMRGPYGIVSDVNENIYVCGNRCLRLVSKRGRWEQIIAEEERFAPQTVLVCDKTNRLYVGQAKGRQDLLVFQM